MKLPYHTWKRPTTVLNFFEHNCVNKYATGQMYSLIMLFLQRTCKKFQFSCISITKFPHKHFSHIIYMSVKILVWVFIWQIVNRTPPTSLSTNVHYEKMTEMFNSKGHFCVNILQLQSALQKALQVNPTTLSSKPKYLHVSHDFVPTWTSVDQCFFCCHGFTQ